MPTAGDGATDILMALRGLTFVSVVDGKDEDALAYDLVHRLEHPQAATIEAKLSGVHAMVGPL
ncbi:hypothetical protein [Paractinoplanes atraurantiacus]|uniref:Uncharacterized protein n=1 Tax=Paractinoplanes atraurantiacus TaxID=1036182 RepID=A0A285KKN1_9ACTN|nr:hypothetical protein [Actinoplanes atraurantiacus]SNY71831.1 hypothetical protein SAMN05421748_1419 [Actinoplanes atraurantiacus]